jgi:outer membrane protein assembly factor BamB
MMKRHWTVAGLAALATLAPGAARAAYTQVRVTTRPFQQKIGGTGVQIDGDVRQVAVNSNPGSPYYGWVYFAYRAQGSTATNKVLIYRPTASAAKGAPAYEDTGLTISVPAATPISPNPANYAPLGVSVGSDDTVWVTDYSGRRVLQAPGAPTSPDTSVTATQIIDLNAYDVQALAELPSGWTVGSPRNVIVSGPASNATVIVTNNTADGVTTDNTVQKFTVAGSTVTYGWTRAIQAVAGNATSQGATGYNAALDSAGNVYVPLSTGAGETAFMKFDASGAAVPFSATTPANAHDASFPGTAVVADANVPGGGYIYWFGGYGSPQNRENFYVYNLNGDLLDAYGKTNAATPAAFDLGKDILSINVLGYTNADDLNNLYFRFGGSSGNANFAKLYLSPPALSANSASKSSATVYNGVVYFGSGDGNLYAVDTATGDAVSGFPVDIRTLTGDATANVLGRPTVRIAPNDTPPYLYFTTTTGRVGRMPLDGGSTGAWVSAPLVTATNVAVTPAVSDAAVYVAMGDGATATAFRLNMTTGVVDYTTPLTDAKTVVSSPAVYGDSIYVGTDAGIFRIHDDGTALTVQAGTTSNTSGSPFIDLAAPSGPTMYAADNAGTVYARNASNFVPDAGFNGGSVTLTNGTSTPTLSTGPYVLNGKIYVGADDDKVYVLNELDGSGGADGGSMVFFDANALGVPLTGTWRITKDVSAAPAAGTGWNIVFGNRGGMYYQVRETDPSDYHVTVLGDVNQFGIDTVPAIDRSTNSEFVGMDKGYLYKVPAF